MNNICKMCKQAAGCDQVFYDCPLCDFIGTSFTFKDASGNAFQLAFKSGENAEHFADYAGYIFIGRK
jgi:hypothetical protein